MIIGAVKLDEDGWNVRIHLEANNATPNPKPIPNDTTLSLSDPLVGVVDCDPSPSLLDCRGKERGILNLRVVGRDLLSGMDTLFDSALLWCFWGGVEQQVSSSGWNRCGLFSSSVGVICSSSSGLDRSDVL